jgi:hypothetical protein
MGWAPRLPVPAGLFGPCPCRAMGQAGGPNTALGPCRAGTGTGACVPCRPMGRAKCPGCGRAGGPWAGWKYIFTTIRTWPNSTQNTSLMGEDCPHLYVVPPTINFRCETNSTISPVTHRTQLFYHMTTYAHNLEGYYRLILQFSCHRDFRDLTETSTGSPVNV